MKFSLPNLAILAFALSFTACDDGGKGETDTLKTDDSGPVCEDLDGDGFCTAEGDCDDTNGSINPDASETCDGVDSNCDGVVDTDLMDEYWVDSDGDGFGNPGGSEMACEAMPGYVPAGGQEDCNDSVAVIYPGAEEVCNAVDDNCNEQIDEGYEYETYYRDFDGDGYGDPDMPSSTCAPEPGYVDNADDCNDTDAGEPVHVDAAAAGTPHTGGTGLDSADTGVGTGSADSPFGSIQEGIEASSDCVFVEAGTYEEDIDFGGREIHVIGRDGPESTVIDGTCSGPVVTFNSGEGAGAILEGFTITGGCGYVTEAASEIECSSAGTCSTTITTYMGGGIYINGSSPTLLDLIVMGNELPPYSYTTVSSTENAYVFSYGGGIYLDDGSPTMSRVNVTTNTADSGGGMYITSSGNMMASKSWFDNNHAAAGGGVASEGSFTATNVIMVNNGTVFGTDGGFGAAAIDVATGDLTLNHVTAVGNDGEAAIYAGPSSAATLTNSIFYDNDDGSLLDGESGSTVTVEYCDVFLGSPDAYGAGVPDATGTAGNLSADPAFTAWSDNGNTDDDDFHLRTTSPAKDVGTGPADTDGSASDMGAFGGPGGTGW